VYILTNGPIVHLPDNTTIQANKAGIIPLHTSLAQLEQSALSFPQLKTSRQFQYGNFVMTVVKFYLTNIKY